MNPRNHAPGNGRLWLASVFTALLTAGVGLALFLFPIGGGILRTSYDLPFALRGNLPVTNAVIVYLDEASHSELNQPMMAPWDRALHAQLVDQLSAQGAKAIVFDILFTEASGNTNTDEKLTRAIRQSGRVIVAGNYQQQETTENATARWEELPYEPFRTAAAGWGNANLTLDPDYGIRSFFPTLHNISGEVNLPTLSTAAAKFAGANERAINSNSPESRWLNYYGPPGSIPGISYFVALMPEGVPPGFFQDKIVFIGSKMSADFSGKGKDEFRTPYSFWGGSFAPGVDIHATATLNILRGDWLVRLPFTLELVLLILVAVTAGFGLMRAHPLWAVVITLGFILLVAVVAHLLAWHGHVWFAWLILIGEAGVALLCSVIYNSLRLFVQKRLLEESLGAHLSPKVVKRLLNDSSLRKPGGSQLEISIMFTDIANFSRISETMDSDDLVRMMNRYFEVALGCVHETDGTVVKLIGDAIFAIWNAPLDQPDHRERACRSALLLRERIVGFDPDHLNVPLHTRVGLHSGVACVGNIGSTHRFDYTALGENINLTSRLEGLNKFLGTSVLAMRDVQTAVESTLLWRPVGRFQMKGMGRAVEVFELLGALDQAESTRVWREKFAEALHDFHLRHFDSAEEKFRRTIALRQAVEPEFTTGAGRMTADGPSQFYLNRIAEFRVEPPPPEWIGEVGMDEK